MSDKKKNLAGHVGTCFAYFQAFVDDALAFGFKKLKSSGKSHTKGDPRTVQGKVIRGAKGVARFLGEVGESFYDEYEEIKAKKTEEDKKK